MSLLIGRGEGALFWLLAFYLLLTGRELCLCPGKIWIMEYPIQSGTEMRTKAGAAEIRFLQSFLYVAHISKVVEIESQK
jgi:hypothetical protein